MIHPNPLLRTLQTYTPGDQPSSLDVIKLNTNEFPYAAAPEVIQAIAAAANDDVRLYPSPRCDALRQRLAEFLGVRTENILVGNGSDEILRLIVQAYGGPDRMSAIVRPTYSLYPTLIQMFGAEAQSFELKDLTGIPDSLVRAAWDLLFLSSPNAPLGTMFSDQEIASLASSGGLLALDEAYIDFAGAEDHSALPQKYENVVLIRTFSKSFGLAGLRVGYALGAEVVIAELGKLADSYNVNRLSQAAAVAALDAAKYYRGKAEEIIANRSWLGDELRARGFQVPESRANFLFAFHARAAEIFSRLRERNIFVRHFSDPPLDGGIRVSIGTREQLDALLSALDALSLS